MGASTYIYNSPYSTNAIDIETTGAGCAGLHSEVGDRVHSSSQTAPENAYQ
jgi:hypothetical protein